MDTPRTTFITRLRSGDWLTAGRLAGYPRLFLAGFAIAALLLIATADGILDRNGKVLGTDFLNVWAASALTIEGRPEMAYDYATHAEVERRVAGAGHPHYYGWHYPPLFLLAVLPLALLPYGAALALYLAATLPAYLAALGRLLPGRDAWVAALAFPGVWINIAHGQNGFLTVGLLGGGLMLLERRPWLAGTLLGLLAYKPQFGLLVPLALAAGGHGRAFAAATGTVLAASGLALALFGPDVWLAFFHSLTPTRTILEQGAPGWAKLHSVFSAVRSLGGGITLAYAVQGLALVTAAIAVVAAWRRPLPLRLRAAVLVAAIPFTTPYVFDYDLVMLALPIALLAAEGRETGFRPWEKTMLAVIWLLPAVSRSLGILLSAQLAPLVLAAFVFLLFKRTRNASFLRSTAHEGHVQI